MAISERRMVQMANERTELKKEIAELAKRVSEIDGKLITEFDRRGVKAITAFGVQIKKVQAEGVAYHAEDIERDLGRIRPKLLQECQVTTLDMKRVALLVQAGKIKPAWLNRRSHTTKNAPYISISHE